jgi:hypothetical protein
MLPTIFWTRFITALFNFGVLSGGAGLARLPQIAWVLVHIGSFGVYWGQSVRISGVSFLYSQALICQRIACHNPNQE